MDTRRRAGTSTGPHDADDETDGRVVRRERNRDAIIDAIMVLIHAGEIAPSMADIARLAGVSERSIFRHFDTREALLGAVIDRQMEVVTSLLHEIPSTGSLTARVGALVAERARLYEEITPVRRAALQMAAGSEQVAGQLADSRVWLRDELEEVFARELARRHLSDRRDLVAAIGMATSWEAWDQLRTVEGCSVVRSRRILERMLTRALGAG
jgi:AcrR family transcriptional regulator